MSANKLNMGVINNKHVNPQVRSSAHLLDAEATGSIPDSTLR